MNLRFSAGELLLHLAPSRGVNAVERLACLDRIKLLDQQLDPTGQHRSILAARRRKVLKLAGDPQRLLDTSAFDRHEADTEVGADRRRDGDAIRCRRCRLRVVFIRLVRLVGVTASGTPGDKDQRSDQGYRCNAIESLGHHRAPPAADGAFSAAVASMSLSSEIGAGSVSSLGPSNSAIVTAASNSTCLSSSRRDFASNRA